jgi:hypothetical protein
VIAGLEALESRRQVDAFSQGALGQGTTPPLP